MLKRFAAVFSISFLFFASCKAPLKPQNNEIKNNLLILPAPVTEPKAETKPKTEEQKAETNPYLEGLIHYKNKEFDQAVAEFNKAIEAFPEIKDYSLYYLFKINKERHDYDGCRKYYEIMVREFPKSRWIEECMYEMGKIFFMQKKWNESIGVLNEFKKKYPQSSFTASSNYHIGMSYIYLGEKEKGKEIFKYLWLYYPSSAEGREAERLLKELYETESVEGLFTPSELLIRADKFYGAMKFDEAISISKLILNSDFEENYKIDALRKIAECYERMKKYLNAIVSYKELIGKVEREKDRKELPSIYYRFARACYQINYKEGFEWVKKKLIKKFPDSEFVKDLLYTAGRYYEDEKDFDRAVESFNEVLKKDKDGTYRDDALWHIGWIYYMNGELTESARYFIEQRENFKNRDNINKSIYWSYKSLEKNEESNKAIEVLKNSVEDYQSYYWFLCDYKAKNNDDIYYLNPDRFEKHVKNISDSLKNKGLFLNLWNEIIKKTASEDTKYFIKRAMLLWRIGLIDDSTTELKYARKTIQKSDREGLLSLAEILWISGNYSTPIRILSSISVPFSDALSGMAIKVNEIFYPAAYWDEVYKNSKENGADPFLVLAIMRQESFYEPNSLSHAGAIGLLQVMPETAKKIFKENGQELFEKNQLYKTDINILAGIKYISKLLKKYDNNLVYAIAAYNAGEHKIKEWQSRFPDRDIDEFIESIPYPETKNYIKKVIVNYENYYSIYSDKE